MPSPSCPMSCAWSLSEQGQLSESGRSKRVCLSAAGCLLSLGVQAVGFLLASVAVLLCVGRGGGCVGAAARPVVVPLSCVLTLLEAILIHNAVLNPLLET